MAIYFPPLFCGQGTALKSRKDFEIEFDDGDTMTIVTGDKCIVNDIFGYGYNIRKENTDKEFRIMNSSMQDYFNIIDKIEPNHNLHNFGYNEFEGNIVTLQKNFEIQNVVKILSGQQFLHYVDKSSNGIFHDLFSVNKKEKVLRMKDAEFREYF